MFNFKTRNMGLRKSKTEEFDVNGLLDDINQQENFKTATTEVDVQIDELRNVCLELGDYFQKMDKARKTIDQYLMVATKIEYDGKTLPTPLSTTYIMLLRRPSVSPSKPTSAPTP